MISIDTLQADWIKQTASKNRNADKILIEKVIRALLLLEGLAQSELPFVFKGGTAVMLLQSPAKRFSIDIDIIIPELSGLEAVLGKLILHKGFSKYAQQTRKAASTIKKFHYKFYYNPVYQRDLPEDSILLDIVVEPFTYQNIIPVEIDSPFIKQDGFPVKVNVPSIDDILADKLTAYAPNTTGIPYEKGGISKSMEIIKQLYDIGNLFEVTKDLRVVEKTFIEIAKKQIAYRKLTGGIEEVIDDIILTSMCLSTRGNAGKGNFTDLQEGVSKIKTFIFSESYQIEKAIIHASRAAYIAKLIELKEKTFARFIEPMQIKDWMIGNPLYIKLNKLKKSNPEAFFYWYQVSLL